MEEDIHSGLAAFYQGEYIEHHADAQKRLEHSVRYAEAALKSLFLLNGGSVVAILTFVGNTHSRLDSRGIFWAIIWLVLGLASDLIAYFGAYFSQSYFMDASYARAKNAQGKVLSLDIKMDDETPVRIGNLWIGLSVFMAIVSFLMFVSGALVALFAIT